MHISKILTTMASFSLSSAAIIGFSVPNQIKPGDGFTAYINTAYYIPSVYDVAVVFGVAPGAGHVDAIGTVMASHHLGHEHKRSNVKQPIQKLVTMPSHFPEGEATVSFQAYSLYGATASGTLMTYNVSVTIGNSTSDTYVTDLTSNP
jgi:necrosis-inducing secreted protein 1